MLLKHLKSKAIGPLLILFFFVLVFRGYSQEIPGAYYIVKKGDTLWGISSSHYTDPFLWPKLWGKNVSIAHPDKIVPGQKIFLPSEELLKNVEKNNQAIENEKAPEIQVSMNETKPEEMNLPAETPREIPSLQPEFSEPEEQMLQVPDWTEADLISGGFIMSESSPIGPSGEIIASENQHTLLGEGDIVYLLPVSSHTFHVGEMYSVYETVRSVRHPKTHRLMGKLIRIKGIVEIIPNQMPHSEKETFSARIIKSFDLINLRDLLMPYEPVDPIDLTLRQNPFPKELKGIIVGSRDLKEANGQNDFVYLDKGARDGIRRGDLFVVYKEGKKVAFYSPDGRERLPQRIIAELEIISVQKETATAIVGKSIEPIVVGDKISNPPPPAP
ncbi:MAG: LysM peptidoglycan-binding domain-containing protein [Nitrospiria bacterium]